MAAPLRLFFSRHLVTSRVSTPLLCSQYRFLSTLSPTHPHEFPAATPPPPPANTDAPLARLPTASLIRALLLHTITGSPTLLALGTKVMLKTADNIERIPPLKWAVDKTFYVCPTTPPHPPFVTYATPNYIPMLTSVQAHYCAGSTPTEVTQTATALCSLGYSGLILAYAREVEASPVASAAAAAAARTDIDHWLAGTLKTITLSTPGDFVAIKLTGAGPACLPLLSSLRPCTDIPELATALDTICTAARERRVGLLVDAEQAGLQQGVDRWAVYFMRRHNTPGHPAVVYNTYQMYLKRSAGTLRDHMALAEKEGWRLGVKLVRGAYLHSDPRDLIHGTKEATDSAYDSAAEHLIKKGVDTVIASHNKASIENALRLRGKGDGMLVFAQLMGMADELSLSLVGRAPVLKYAVWGTTGECLKYLLRRAEENSDAVGRSEENYRAVVDELRRRVGTWGR